LINLWARRLDSRVPSVLLLPVVVRSLQAFAFLPFLTCLANFLFEIMSAFGTSLYLVNPFLLLSHNNLSGMFPSGLP
jgi:hypothetical protein